VPLTLKFDSEEDHDDSSSSSEDSEEREDALFQSAVGIMAGKRPASERGEGDEVDEQEELPQVWLLKPDIGSYLMYFHLDHAQQIAICRTWANYLAAQNRPAKYIKKDKKGQ